MTSLQSLRNFRAHNAGRRISFVSGNFKVIHPGHIRLLRFAREMADRLVVGVVPGNPWNAMVSERDRLENVNALNMVDLVCLLDTSLAEALRALRPDFVVKGKEYEDGDNPEAAILDTYNGKLVFSSGSSVLSEADVIDGTSAHSLSFSLPGAYMQRHGIVPEDLRRILEAMRDVRITVVGDSIVDEYIHCDPLGMSQEDPTIVVRQSTAHAASLGAQVRFATVCGYDDTADFVREKLREYGVHAHIFEDDTRPTTLKQRFRCRGKTLLRVSHLQQHDVDRRLARRMLKVLLPCIDDSDLLIFSDFNYGCLSPMVVDSLTSHAQQRKATIVADSQSSSQIGDVGRFCGATLLTPTEREARLALKDFASGLVVLADNLLHKAGAGNVIMTLGEAGILIQPGGNEETDQLPALNPMAKDVAGAGDSLLVVAALALAAGGNIWQAACLGSLGAAIQVSREGNIPLSADDMLRGLLNR